MSPKTIASLQDKLAGLDKAAADVRREIKKKKYTLPKVPAWLLIADYIRRSGDRKLEPFDIAAGLVGEGKDLGAKPHRTVTATVLHPALVNVFKVHVGKDGTKIVTLAEWARTSSLLNYEPQKRSGKQARA